MAYDGSIKIDTKIDNSGFSSGLSGLSSLARSGLSGVESAFKAVGTAVTVAATAMGAVAAKSIQVGSSFEAGMSQVQAISGATGKELQALSEKAKEMGAKTKFSATESAEAMNYMAMAGWKAEDMISGIDGVMNLAAASGENLGTVSDIVTDALTAFGLQAKDSAHFADVLAKAASSSNTNVSMMGATFKYAAPIAGALKYSIEDTAVAIGMMANAGIKGEQAGTALRSMLTRLIDPPKDAATALADLGVSAANADGTVKPLRETISELREKFAGLSDAEKTEYASNIAGQEAMSGLLAIVNASDEDFQKLTESIDDASGAAENQATIMQDNLKGALTILGSSAEGLGIEIYESIQQPLRDVVEEATNMVNQLTAAFKNGGLEGLVAEAGKIMGEVLTKVTQAAPKAIKAGSEFVLSLIKGLGQNNSKIAKAALEIGKELVSSFAEILPEIAKAGADIAVELVKGLFGEDIGGKFEELVNGIAEGFASIKNAADEPLERVGTLISNIITVALDLANAVLPVITGAFEFLAGHLDVLAPALVGVAAGFAALKVAETVSAGITAVKLAIEGVGIAMAANPIGLVVAAVAGLAVGVTALISSYNDLDMSYSEAVQEQQKYVDLSEKELEAARDRSEAYDNMMDSRNQAAEKAAKEWDINQRLAEELEGIVDENGRIKEGYEDRANVITTQLADALGIEIKIVDGQVQKYDELKGKIDDVIRKKKAEALLSADQAAYTEAVMNQADAFADVAEKEGKLKEARERLKEVNVEAAQVQADYNEQVRKNNEGTDVDYEKAAELKNRLDELNETRRGCTQEVENSMNALSESEHVYDGYMQTIQNHEGLMAAVASGDVAELDKAISDLTYNFQTAEHSTKESLEAQAKSFDEQYKVMLSLVDKEGSGVTQAQVDQMRDLKDRSLDELEKLSPGAKEKFLAAGEAAKEGLAETEDDIVGTATDISDSSNEALGSADTKTTGQEQGNQYKEGIYSTAEDVNAAGVDVSERANDGLGSSDTGSTGKNQGVRYANGVRSLASGALNAGKNLADNANSGAASISAYSTGADFGNGFGYGIGSTVDFVATQAYNLVSNAIASAKSAQQSASPSKKTRKLGRDNGQGYALGIKDESKEVDKAAAGVTEGALEKMRSAVQKMGGQNLMGGLVAKMKAAVAAETSGAVVMRLATGSSVNKEVATSQRVNAENETGVQNPIYVETHVTLGDETELAVALTPAIEKEMAFGQ